jgi:hypothetical protein
MPAFGKDGIVNINQSTPKKTYQLVKPDGTVVMSCDNKDQLEMHKTNLSQKFNCELNLVEKKLQLI